MKRALAFATVALLVSLASPAQAAPPHDMAVGSQKVTQSTGDFQHVSVAALSGPAGEDPRGNVEIKFQSDPFFGGGAHLKGRVVCLNVNANEARVAALLREPHNGRTHVTLIIDDNGNPVAGQSPDLVFIGFTSSPPANCASGGLSLVGDRHGDVQVRDAT